MSRKSRETTKKRSQAFQATRKHHSTEAAEDYAELIAELIEAQGQARVGHIAQHLGISHVTALRTIQRLQAEGYVELGQRRPLKLTEKGRKVARFARERHKLMVDFLVYIGVPLHIAEVDVEGAEHHISETTLSCMQRFLEKNRALPDRNVRNL